MNEKTQIIPIFILGSARCGTTSLSNRLCQHPEIAGLTNEKHWGVHEAHFISTWSYFFPDIISDENYFFFLQSFLESDLFRISDLDKEVFYQYKPDDFCDFYRFFMERFSSRAGSLFWLNNAPRQSFFIDVLIENFPDAQFIVIKRNVVDASRSNVKYSGSKDFMSIAKKVYRHQSDYEALERHRSNIPNLIEVEFDEYVTNTEGALRAIINSLGLQWDSALLKNPYSRNTSFQGTSSREDFFGKIDKLFVKFITILLIFVPWIIKMKLRELWEKRKVKSLQHPPFKYRLHSQASHFTGPKFQRDSNRS